MAYNLSLTVYAQRITLSQTFFERSVLLDRKRPFCVFDPLLGATYAVHIKLIGKPIVDFLLVIIEFFFR